MELLSTHTGPFVDFLKGLGVWDADGLTNLRELLHIHRDVRHVAFAHGNYLGRQPLPPGNSIVYCPRTHAYFGHPSHPFADLVSRGVCVALGTDSLASNPDLDILAELRFLSERRPEVDGATLLRMATLNGAKALGWDNETGSLTPGKSADFVVVPLPAQKEADPHRWAFYSTGARMTFFRGKDVTPRRPGS
jgi:cytosine/adenosine deaminase-related metal-dependent hydrolase